MDAFSVHFKKVKVLLHFSPFLSYAPSRNKPVKRGHYSVISSGDTLLASLVEKISYIINHISLCNILFLTQSERLIHGTCNTF